MPHSSGGCSSGGGFHITLAQLIIVLTVERKLNTLEIQITKNKSIFTYRINLHQLG